MTIEEPRVARKRKTFAAAMLTMTMLIAFFVLALLTVRTPEVYAKLVFGTNQGERNLYFIFIDVRVSPMSWVVVSIEVNGRIILVNPRPIFPQPMGERTVVLTYITTFGSSVATTVEVQIDGEPHYNITAATRSGTVGLRA
jgi:hypothetical protein